MVQEKEVKPRAAGDESRQQGNKVKSQEGGNGFQQIDRKKVSRLPRNKAKPQEGFIGFRKWTRRMASVDRGLKNRLVPR